MDPEKNIDSTKEGSSTNDLASSSKNSKVAETKVRVALRVRPFIPKEIADDEQKCVRCFKETSQILLGKDRTFNFDKVFDENTSQQEVFLSCAEDLMLSCLSGYNATILAYGQTGSGKTFTMGTNTGYESKADDMGIIPRVMRQLFTEIEKRQEESEFLIKVSFLEIHNEEIQDLLDTNSRIKINQNILGKNPISIREEKDGSISVVGITEEKVASFEEISACLERGALQRSTASTLMNDSSSRSHGIFTISVEQHQIKDLKDQGESKENQPEDTGFTTAKFHFVDLAGSERIKKTGATGTTMREGININRGLLALGNVISALTDDTGKISHVPYRESKVTRILQDSLGGNSRTLMIACISPAESNFDESLNTLKYASRARNIKNKPIINRDPQSTLISQLKQQVFELHNEIMGYRKILSSQMKDGTLPPNFQSSIKSLAPQGSFFADGVNSEEVRSLKMKLFQCEKELASTKTDLQHAKKSSKENEISYYTVLRERDLLKLANEKYKEVLKENKINFTLENPEMLEIDSKNLLEEYNATIEKLKQDLRDKEKSNQEIQKELESLMKSSAKDHELLLDKIKVIQTLKRQIKKQENTNGKSVPTNTSTSLNENIVEEEVKKNTDQDKEIDDEEEEMDKHFETTTLMNKKELLLVDGTIYEKEILLQDIEQNQLILENKLAEEMKEQYHTKIIQLENELKSLEKQRDQTLQKVNTSSQQESERNKIITSYKQKLTDLESKLKEFRQKEKEKENLSKVVDSQRKKITQLDDEINRIKSQKLQLQKKMKEDSEGYERWKQTRTKELTDMKKKNQDYEATINKLKNESKKREQQYKKRVDELLAKSMSADLFKTIKASKTPSVKSTRKVTNSSFISDISAMDSSLIQMNDEEAHQLIDYCTENLIENFNLFNQIEKDAELLRITEEEVEKEREKLSKMILKKEQAESKKKDCRDIESEEILQTEIDDCDFSIEDFSNTIDTLEQKGDFLRNKINEMTQILQQKPNLVPEELLTNNEKLKNPQNYQILIRSFLGKYINSSLEYIKLQEKLNQNVASMSELRKKLEDTERNAKLAELQHENNITKLTKEYERNQLLLLKQQAFDVEDVPDEQDKENLDEEVSESKITPFTTLSQARQRRAGQGMQKSSTALPSNKRPNSSKTNADSPADKLASPKKESGFAIPSPSMSASTGSTSTATANQKLRASESLSDQNKRLEKTISEMTKKQKQSDKLIETYKNKCEILQAKYDQAKKASTKSGMPKDVTDSPRGSISSLNLEKLSLSSSFVGTQTPTQSASSFRNTPSNNTKQVIEKPSKPAVPTITNLKEKREKLKQATTMSSSTSNLHSAPNVESFKIDNIPIDELNKPVSIRKGSSNIVTTSATVQNTKGITTNFNMDKLGKVGKPPSGLSSSILKSGQMKMSESFIGKTPRDDLDSKLDELIDDLNIKRCDSTEQENLNYDNNFWKCQATIETSGPVWSVASQGNMMYSAGNKTINVWSLDTLTSVSEISAHNSWIKAMALWPEKNLLFTAGDKTISIWDLVSLQSIGVLKGHKEDIRTLHISGDMLISGSKGSIYNGAIFFWDLRSSNPLDEKEKNQEAFSMASYKDILYYGSRNHQVRRMDLKNLESLAPFEPPHYDVVSSLSIVKEQLVSGSRDKNLRLWALDYPINNNMATLYAHQDWINVTETNASQTILYSGSKDGTVKVWGVSKKKMKCFSDINAHSQPINSLCKLYDEYESMFATGSLDKTIKLWKPESEELLNAKAEDVGDDSGPNSLQSSGVKLPNESAFNISENFDSSIDYESDAK